MPDSPLPDSEPDSAPLSILYLGASSGTSLQRRRALEELGHDVLHIDDAAPSDWRFQIYRLGFRLRRPPDLVGSNRAVLAASRQRRWNVLWVDRSITIRPETLATVRRESPGTVLVSYSPDDYRILRRDSIRFGHTIPEYDLHVTTKSYNVAELREWGARDAYFVDNAFCPEIHRPVELSSADRERLACQVGFIGFFEDDRAQQMLGLAREGIPLVIRGHSWRRFEQSHPNLMVHHEFLGDDEYPKALNATEINLGFLRKSARDLQTTRSIEIPACGAFMLAERTDEHRALFREGEEAEFFEGFDELLEKCRHYLAHPAERERIAAAGLARCREDGYDNTSRLSRVVDYIRSEHLAGR